MIKYMHAIHTDWTNHHWCDHCKKRCNEEEREPYLVCSTNENVKDMVLCKACLDLALNEQGILPEEF